MENAPDTAPLPENQAQEHGSEAPKKEQDKKTVMSVLAYIGPLVIVSYIIGKDDPFVMFHVRQGLVLFVIEVALWLLSSVFWHLYALYNLINLAILILAIVGITNAVQGKEKELPLVGRFAHYFII